MNKYKLGGKKLLGTPCIATSNKRLRLGPRWATPRRRCTATGASDQAELQQRLDFVEALLGLGQGVSRVDTS